MAKAKKPAAKKPVKTTKKTSTKVKTSSKAPAKTVAKVKKTEKKEVKKEVKVVKKEVKVPSSPTKVKAVTAKPVKKETKPVVAAVAKKGTTKKPVAKPVTAPEPKVAAMVKPLPKATTNTGKGLETLKPTPQTPKAAPPQLTIFPIPTQRPIAHKPAKPLADDRTRYSEEELKEFEALIHKKLEKAREEYRILKDTLNRNNDEGTDATSGGNTKVLEDGAETAEKENLSQLAARQQKYITNLENALVRIKNGTYGICSVTGKLIPKERLIAVPHTTQSIEAKMMQTD